MYFLYIRKVYGVKKVYKNAFKSVLGDFYKGFYNLFKF